MDWSEKIQGRGGGFLMTDGEDTSAVNHANIRGSGQNFWAFEVRDPTTTLSTLEDNGADCLGTGTSGTNYGIGFTSSDPLPTGIYMPSTPGGFTKIVVATGTIWVWRTKSAFFPGQSTP